MRLTPVILLAATLVACSPASPATPAAAYTRFLVHISQARAGGSQESPLLDDFDSSTKAALTARSTAAAQATGSHQPADSLYQLLQGPPPVMPTSIKVVEQSDDRATLEVEVDAGASGRVVMVREAGRWRVHLDLDAK